MEDHKPEQLGNYKIEKKIGQGGFASVYLGKHIHLNRVAAIKTLNLNTSLLMEEHKKRFVEEASIIAAIENKHIIPIWDYGYHGDVPFLVMKYAKNGSLRQHHPLGSQLTMETILKYVEQIANGLQYAHDQGIIHRDIKPDNILLDEDNNLLLSDFGLAKPISTLVNTISIQGTPVYMAPEQFNGKLFHESDQYAVAVMIYEWACGKHPFIGNTFEEFGNLHMNKSVPSLREKAPTISKTVESVIMQALAKDPKSRFESIMKFYEQLFNAYYEMDIYDRNTKVPYRRVSSYRGHSTRVRAVAWSPNGKYIASGGHDSFLYIWDAENGRLVGPSQNTENLIFSIAWAPDNSRIAIGQQDGVVRVYTITSNDFHLCKEERHSDSVRSVAWSLDGKYIASASDDRKVHIREANNPDKVLYIYKGHTAGVRAVAWSPDSKYIASASNDKTVHIWEATTADKALYIFQAASGGHTAGVRTVAWSPDGKYIASGSVDTTVKIWKIDSGTIHAIHTYQQHGDCVNAVAWSPKSDAKFIATGSDDKTVHIINAETGSQVLLFQEHKETVNAVAWSPSGTHVVSAASNRTGENADKTIRVWQLQ